MPKVAHVVMRAYARCMSVSRRLERLGWALAALLLSLAVAWGAGAVARTRARAAFGATVAADARLRAALLASEVARFRLLPLALADDVDLLAALRGAPGAARMLDTKLESLATRTGAAAIYVVGRDGIALAASNWRTPVSFVGRDYRFRRYVFDAQRSGAGEQFAFGTVSHQPGLYLSRRTQGGGVVVVKLEFDAIERAWRGAGGVTFVTDRHGIVLVTSRPGWRFATIAPIDATTAARARADIGVTALRASPLAGAGADGLLARATPADASGWRVYLAISTRDAVDGVVRWVRLATALAVLVLVGLAWTLRGRARRRDERTAALEAAVVERTAALSREIEERAAAEAHAADLRDGLRQANRLATLGQVTASVAHETAQPVAAIRTYAATGETLLDRGELDAVRGNLRAIARLTDRIGAVTAQLRGFARKGTGKIGPVPLAEVVEGAQLLLKERLSRVALDLPPIPADLRVVAGRVRLEQVLVNLLQNATEALDATDAPRIWVTLAVEGGTVRLTIRDNGPGIAPEIADRLFTPFATSRATGLGLGLVIAHDIMVDLGGTLRVVPGGSGACFELTLRRAA